MAAESSKGIKQFKVPHVYAIIFALMVIFAVLTWIVPSGSYQRQEVNGREVTVAGTYEQSEKTYIDEETGDEVDLRQGVFDVLQAPTRGIQEAIEVVAFILIVGGSFQVITKTGAITSGMGRVVRRFKKGLRTISWTAKSRPSPATTGSRPASRHRARRLPARS